MLEMFDIGRRKRFFEMWSDNFQRESDDHDVIVQQLEFYLNVHFAVFARKHDIEASRF